MADCPHDEVTLKLDATLRGRRTAARCLACGHRHRDITRDGRTVPPRPTRSTPARWLTELPRRHAARRMGRRLDEARP